MNEGNPLSVQKDMLPVLGYFSDEEIVKLSRGTVKIIDREKLMEIAG